MDLEQSSHVLVALSSFVDFSGSAEHALQIRASSPNPATIANA
jgi:hypothetical protein